MLAPRSIAIVGGAPAERVVRQCLKLGFDGPIWPVHPKRRELAGVACLPSLDALPGVPDAVFLGVNRHATVEAMGVLRAMGAGSAVCYGSGFAELGAVDLQSELLEAAGDVPFLGPNCYGFVNTFDRVALWPDEHGMHRLAQGVAIVSQSGNVAVNLTFQQRGLRLGTMVSVGNQASVGMEDCIDAFLDDPRITTIGLFLEAVRDPQHFATAAQRAHSQGVPIVALQTGRSTAGAEIAMSHTGSMAGRAAAYDALFARYGVATVTTPAEMLETLKLLDNGGRLSGPRMVSMSCSGGEASLVADRVRRRTVAVRAIHHRAATSHRIDRDRAGHRQQSVRLQHVHVGRPARDLEVLHGRPRWTTRCHHARPRRSPEPRQRCVSVDRQRRRSGRRGRRHRAARRRRRHDGRVPQRGAAHPHRRARAHPLARAGRRPRRARSSRARRGAVRRVPMPRSLNPATFTSSTKRRRRPDLRPSASPFPAARSPRQPKWNRPPRRSAIRSR